MTKILVLVAGFGLVVSGAQACEFQQTAKGERLDKTTVASVTIPQPEPVTIAPPTADNPPVKRSVE
jgi:hypothetical protein